MEMKIAAKAVLALGALEVAGFIWVTFGADRAGRRLRCPV